MCGITGYYLYGSSSSNDVDRKSLQQMTQVLSHRGPDASDTYCKNKIGLGHQRLSIIDLSTQGNQPMHSADGRYVLVYNGEVYNYLDLRKKLEVAGYQFSSTSDTEVILAALTIWGIERTLPCLNGMFAFALWDNQQEELTLVRDSIGIKPLYWSINSRSVLFGSEIKSLKCHPDFLEELDKNSLTSYFAHLYMRHPHTIYKDCYMLSPGTFLTITKTGECHFKNFKPLSMTQISAKGANDNNVIDEFDHLVKKSVERHCISDVPVAVFLSGGNDSALVASCLPKDRDFKSFSIGYEEKDYDESARAQDIANHLGLEHETLMVGPKDVQKVLDRIPTFYDEPFADGSAIPTYLLSQHVQKYTKVALSGDGADELFGGYPRYANAAFYWDKINYVPTSLRRVTHRMLPGSVSPNAVGWLRPFLKNPASSIPYIKYITGCSSLEEYFERENYLGLPQDWIQDLNIEYYLSKQFPYKENCSYSSLRSLLLYDQSHRLPDDMLTKVDRASMAASLEVRVPFLDNDIISFSRSLKDQHISPSRGSMKIVLKDVLRKYLPNSIVDAPKSGFHIPMKIWLRTHFKDWALDLLFSEKSTYLNEDVIRKAWSAYCDEGDNSLFYPLWCVLMFQQWARHENSIDLEKAA